jgi:FixJ family two-component response regulator
MMGAVTERRLDALTERRRQVAILAGRGLSNRAIAEKLSLSENTVQKSSVQDLPQTQPSSPDRSRDRSSKKRDTINRLD